MRGRVVVSGPPLPLTCGIEASPSSGEAELTVAFIAALDGGVPPYLLNWNFGDGTFSPSPNPAHTYSSSGQFTAMLDVEDDRGASCSASAEITVTPCVGREVDSVLVKEKQGGAIVNLKILGVGFVKGDAVQIDSGAGFVDVPRTKVRPSKLIAKGVQSLFPPGSTVQVRVRKLNNCASSALPASR